MKTTTKVDPSARPLDDSLPAEFSVLIAGREIVPTDISTIIIDPANARLHGTDSIRVIKDSLQLFGQTEPIGIQTSTRKVIWGNGRVEAMRELGWDQCGAIFINVDNTTAAAMSLALNRTAERSEWDYAIVAANLKALQDDSFDVSKLGWEDYELGPMLANDWTPPAVEPTSADQDGEGGAHPHAVIFTDEQWTLVRQGVERVRNSEHDEAIKESRAIELMVADYLAGS